MTKTEQEEIWKVYPEYPFIEASNLGRVRTKDRYVTVKGQGKRLIKGRVLKQWNNGRGYLCVSLHLSGKTIHLYVHRVIATSFLPNPNNLSEVNHIDCDRTNNRLDNLEWCTRQENIAYRDKLGHGVNNNPGQPVIAVNPETSEVFWFKSQSEAARQFGISQGNIPQVIKGHYNTAGGYWFCCVDEKTVGKTRVKFGDKVAHEVEKLIGENYD